jgi:photosystem II stability/assembly factor-like uncharacterized protein
MHGRTAHRAILVGAAFLVAACGSQGGAATPAEVLLLAANRVVASVDAQLVPRTGGVVLRDDGGGWRETEFVGPVDEHALVGVSFSSPRTAWAFGQRGDLPESGRLLVFRSDDAGQTWLDVSRALPRGQGLRPLQLAFSDAANGWLYGATFLYSGPVPIVTRDSGRTWELRETGPECDLFSGEGIIGGFRFCAGHAQVQCRGWSSLGVAPGTDHYCTPDHPGSAFDVRADGSGVACGVDVIAVAAELRVGLGCSTTADHGETWARTTTVPLDANRAHSLGGIVLRRDGTAFIAVNSFTSTDSHVSFYESRDHGQSWQESALPGAELYEAGQLGRSSWITDR